MKSNIKNIPKIWIINQFANTPNMPGGTRHFEIANYFSKLEWNTEVFSSDFNLSSRKSMISVSGRGLRLRHLIFDLLIFDL